MADQYQGRDHSPGCTHRRPEHGVGRNDDLVTIEKLLESKGFDPYSKCGEYAVRRLSEDQVAYYRAAHRLHDLAQQVHSVARKGPRATRTWQRRWRSSLPWTGGAFGRGFPRKEQARQ
ncbi:hypothetical protein ACTWJ9_30680 (plasmid) [Streptomyces sp. GDS52]|uniref:hypothetical protein n=1 Tax=Streptomyces sp. GDS52 TaxID=3406419 RepID=UPI003FD6BE6A